MFSSSLLEAAVETVQRIWKIEPVRGIRMPEPNAQQTVDLDLLWTDGGLRPRANNLAFLIQQVERGDLELWKQRLRAWTIRGGLLVSSDELYLVQPRPDRSGDLEQTKLDLDALRETLVSPKPHLFTPKALAKLRQGQLSLADLEEEVSERSFSFLDRQQRRLGDSFQEGIDAALRIVDSTSSSSSRSEIKGHTIRFAIAYLGARILQDKNFFGNNIVQAEDPLGLLDRMVEVTNGFFRRARNSADYVPDRVRQELALHMGNRVSFVLTDHRDVGRLYEEAIKKLPRELGSDDWGDLNRHYTPVKLAERMLEALPIERLRPEERYIFDPAAGSGSLLLAATSRLAGMRDIPTGEARKEYLRSHVLGNDLDRYSDLIAQLRYFLASESLGRSNLSSHITDVLPFPSIENFTHENYESLKKSDLLIKPRVIVANPPFEEDGKNQKSSRFVVKALEWLDNGSQFAFVLPQSFLAATTHGISYSRELLTERCRILEVWQCPERSIGINAEQAVCVILGVVGQSQKIFPVSSKAVFSRVESQIIRERGFLGVAWFNQFNSSNAGDKNQFWTSTVAPPISISVHTIPLGDLFYVFNGVNPGRFSKMYPPERLQQSGIKYKRNWRLQWRDPSKLLANPERVPENKRWIRYGKEYLEGPRIENEALFDLSKVLVAKKVNRGSNYPLGAQFDGTGFCPDKNIFCVLPAVHVNKYTSGYKTPDRFPDKWHSLTYEDKCLWLTGICISKVANSLSLIGRKNHEITRDELCNLPLPFLISLEIIDITRKILDLEKRQDPVLDSEFNELHKILNLTVEKSYGNPEWKEIERVGKSSALQTWEIEQNKKILTVLGQVLEISQENDRVLLRLSGLLDDKEEEWIPLPNELPGWALDGTVFEAALSEDIETFQELAQRPWALRKFRHTPYPYLTNDNLKEKLGRIVGLENR